MRDAAAGAPDLGCYYRGAVDLSRVVKKLAQGTAGVDTCGGIRNGRRTEGLGERAPVILLFVGTGFD